MSYNYDYNENRKNVSAAMIAVFVAIGIILVTILSVGGTFVKTYNDLVEMEESVKHAQANVQEKMQRRLELIPDLVETVQAYSDHEEKVFADIANARAALSSSLEGGNLDEISEANNKFSEEINNLLVVAEQYPTLTSGELYVSLMDQLEGSINRISVAREAYNDEVSRYNIKIRKFPGSVLAEMYGFKSIEEFKADEAAKETNMVHFNK